MNQGLEEPTVIDARDRIASGNRQELTINVGGIRLPDEARHGLAGEYIRLIEPETEADPAALLIQFISFFGNVIGRNAFVALDVSRHYGNLFVVVVGATSKGRKGTSLAHIEAIFERVSPAWFDNNIVTGLSSGEGLIHHLRDKPDMPATDDEGNPVKQDTRCLVIETEFAKTLAVTAREGNILSAVIRDCWDGRATAVMTKADPIKSKGGHVSMVVHITASELKKALKSVDRANGFGNRFLWTHSERRHTLPLGGNLDSVDFSALDARLQSCIAYGLKTQRKLSRTVDADDLWKDVYDELSEGTEGPVGDLTSRAESQVMRLALLYALLDKQDEIDVVHLEAALALWGYCYNTVSSLFGDSFSAPLAEHIADILQGNPAGLTLTQLSAQLSNNKSKDEIQEALSELRVRGVATNEKRMSSGPGRRAEVWRVVTNPSRAYAN